MAALVMWTLYCMATAVLAASNIDNFVYYNSGTTTNTQQYKLVSVNAIYNEGYQYKRNAFGSNQWNVGAPLNYLFEELPNGTLQAPSSGLRSSVFFGPVGQGGFEMRGDGRLTDFTIFNNGANARNSAFARKWDLNDAMFGFTLQHRSNNATISKVLQTAPDDINMAAYSIQSLTYSGSYPVSKLTAVDADITNTIGVSSINLTAFSSFEPMNVNMSSMPGVVFWFDVDNRQNRFDAQMNLFFNWPDIIDVDEVSATLDANGFVLNKKYNPSSSLYFTSGNTTFSAQQCDRDNNECTQPITGNMSNAQSLYVNWMKFLQPATTKLSSSSSASSSSSFAPMVYRHYAWNSDTIQIPRESVTSFAVVLSWYFPLRTFNNNEQYLGNYYNNFYQSSTEVNDDILNKLPNITANIASWHRLWDTSTSSMYPDFLRDIYINGPSFISRTGYLLESETGGTGIWRQAESFSCFQVDPPHIHGYRALAYNLIFGSVLQRGTLNMYTFGLESDGLVSELFGGDCGGISGRMGTPSGNPRGDDNSIYVLDMYSQFKWYQDGKSWVRQRYQYVKHAMEWIIGQSTEYGVPYRLVNTNDEHGVIGDINTYNSLLYISALYAMKTMALHYAPEDLPFLLSLETAIRTAQQTVVDLLFQQDGGFFISFWCDDGVYAPYGLQSDVLYGYLWSMLLELDGEWDIETWTFASHLQQEYERNWSKFGLVFMSNRTTPGFNCNPQQTGDEVEVGFEDFDTWEMATIDHATLSLYLNASTANVNRSLNHILKTGLEKYRTLFRDQWDWRDTSSTYYDADPTISRPVVNSHYARQLVEYWTMYALNGQKLNAEIETNELRLSLQPLVSLDGSNGCLPVLIPQASMLLCFDASNQCFELEVLFAGDGDGGMIEIGSLSITNENKQYEFSNVQVSRGQNSMLCP